jgi:hypothetical protein
VNSHTASVRVRISAVEGLDAFEAALGANPLLKGAAVRRGATRAVGEKYEAAVTLRFFAPHQAFEDLPPADLPSLPLGAIKEAASGVGGRLDSVSAQQVDRDAGGEMVSADIDLTVPAAVTVEQLLNGLSETPGVRVSGISWKAADTDGDYKVRIRLSMRRVTQRQSSSGSK